jgi:hypothetical protein
VHDRERPCGRNAGCQRRDARARLCGLDELAPSLRTSGRVTAVPSARRSRTRR